MQLLKNAVLKVNVCSLNVEGLSSNNGNYLLYDRGWILMPEQVFLDHFFFLFYFADSKYVTYFLCKWLVSKIQWGLTPPSPIGETISFGGRIEENKPKYTRKISSSDFFLYKQT